jgi:hypothetical protein
VDRVAILVANRFRLASVKKTKGFPWCSHCSECVCLSDFSFYTIWEWLHARISLQGEQISAIREMATALATRGWS